MENKTEKEGDHKLRYGDESFSPAPPTFKRDDPPIPTDIPTYVIVIVIVIVIVTVTVIVIVISLKILNVIEHSNRLILL